MLRPVEIRKTVLNWAAIWSSTPTYFIAALCTMAEQLLAILRHGLLIAFLALLEFCA